MKLGIMQPYFFPSISYFKLIYEVDVFVFLDDVTFIKKGWINRNKILLNGNSFITNINCKAISQNRNINETYIIHDEKGILNRLKTIKHAYKKAPYFNDVFPYLEHTFLYKTDFLSIFSSNTIIETLNFLGIKKDIKYSSVNFQNFQNLSGEERIISICKRTNASTYVNSEGGKKLYSKANFLKEGIKLNFLKSKYPVFKQFENDFIPMLSIIDVLMFNDKEVVISYLNDYELD